MPAQVFFYRQAERPSVGGAASCAAIIAALNTVIREDAAATFPDGAAETTDASECQLCWSNCWQPRLALSLPAACLVNHFPMSVELTHKGRLVRLNAADVLRHHVSPLDRRRHVLRSNVAC